MKISLVRMALVAAVCLCAQTVIAQTAAQWAQMCQDMANGSNIPDVSRRQNQASPMAPHRPAVPGVYEFNIDSPNGSGITSLVTLTNPGGSLLTIMLSEVVLGGGTVNQQLVYASDVSLQVTPFNVVIPGAGGWNFEFFVGTPGADTFTVSNAPYSFVIGSFGDDTLMLWGQESITFGNDGNDVILGFGPGAGMDQFVTIYGGNGDDVLWGCDSAWIAGATQWQVQFGDVIYGGAGRDSIFGVNGEDDLFGESGDDVIIGGQDGDFIDGGAGDDAIWGDEQLPSFNEGNDYIIDLNSIGVTSVMVYGGGGNDFIYVTSFNNIPDIWGDDPGSVTIPGTDLIISNNVGIPDGQNVMGGQAGLDWFYYDAADSVSWSGTPVLYPGLLPSDPGAAPAGLGGGPNFWSLQADWPLDWWTNFPR